MEKTKRPIDVYGVISEGLVSGRLKSEDVVNGLCWLTNKSIIEMGIFKCRIDFEHLIIFNDSVII